MKSFAPDKICFAVIAFFPLGYTELATKMVKEKKIAVDSLIKCFALHKISFALIAFSPLVYTELSTKMGIYQLSVQSRSLF